MDKGNEKNNKRIQKAIIEKIKSRIDIVDFVSSKQEMKLQGENYNSNCPICKAKTSFVVFPKSQSFYCFACSNGGDIITYVMRTEDREYVEAVKELASFADIDTAENNCVDSSNLMRDAGFYYHSQLRDNPKAKTAIELLHSWGIQGKTIVQLGIVLALTCVYVNIQQQKITRDALTNLNNRVSFEKYLDGTITNYPENREPISLIFIDLLNFRKINNTFGHTEGDIVICNVAEVLKKLCSSKKCFLARYNGDVFAIVTKNILSSEVSEFEDSIKTEIEKIQTKKDIKLTPLICHKYYDVQMKNTKELIQKTLSIISEEKNLKNLTNKKTK